MHFKKVSQKGSHLSIDAGYVPMFFQQLSTYPGNHKWRLNEQMIGGKIGWRVKIKLFPQKQSVFAVPYKRKNKEIGKWFPIHLAFQNKNTWLTIFLLH